MIHYTPEQFDDRVPSAPLLPHTATSVPLHHQAPNNPLTQLIMKEIEGRKLSVIFDIKRRMGEALAIIVRFVDDQ